MLPHVDWLKQHIDQIPGATMSQKIVALGFAPRTPSGAKTRHFRYLPEILRSDECGLRGDRDGHGDPFFCAPDQVILELRAAVERYLQGESHRPYEALKVTIDQYITALRAADPLQEIVLLEGLEAELRSHARQLKKHIATQRQDILHTLV